MRQKADINCLNLRTVIKGLNTLALQLSGKVSGGENGQMFVCGGFLPVDTFISSGTNFFLRDRFYWDVIFFSIGSIFSTFWNTCCTYFTLSEHTEPALRMDKQGLSPVEP